MRTLFIPLLAAAAVLCSAQQPTPRVSDTPKGLSIPAQLDTTIRADKAHAGDLVRFKTLEPVLVSKGIIIPQNAKLFGHVLGAAAKQGEAPSWISVVVDRAEWKERTLPLHAFIFGQILANPAPQTGEADASKSSASSTATVPNHAPVGNRRNLADPRSAIAISRAQNEATWDQERTAHPAAGLSDVKLARHKSGATFLFCEKHNLKIPSGILFMLENVPVQAPAASDGQPAPSPEARTAPK